LYARDWRRQAGLFFDGQGIHVSTNQDGGTGAIFISATMPWPCHSGLDNFPTLLGGRHSRKAAQFREPSVAAVLSSMVREFGSE